MIMSSECSQFTIYSSQNVYVHIACFSSPNVNFHRFEFFRVTGFPKRGGAQLITIINLGAGTPDLH